jgi:hypothetical protein
MGNERMVKSKDLRIGNFVYVSYENEESILKNEQSILKFEFDSGWNFDYIKPIPLTEEWLLKFGFKKGFNDTDMRVQVTKDCSMSIWTCDEKDNCIIGDDLVLTIQYVHQLQNLYFVLTGEELIIKTEKR